MQLSRGKRVQLLFGETDQIGHKPRYQVILEFLRAEGAAGATIVRGIAGFGADSRIHTSTILRLSLDLPLVVTWIDAPERVDRLLPRICELTGHGIVTVEDVSIASYGGRGVEQLRFDLDVADVMTRDVRSIMADALMKDAVRDLIGQPYRALPVVEDGGRLVGVVSNGDLVDRGSLPARLELLDAMEEPAREALLETVDPRRSVAEVMTRNVVTAKNGETLGQATRRMSERRVKRLPVVDRDGRLVGIISRADVLRAVGESFPTETGGGSTHATGRTTIDIMRTDAPVVDAGAGLSTVLDAVCSTRLNRAVVLDNERRVLGVITDAEVLRAVDPTGGGVLGSLMRSVGHTPPSPLRARELVGREPVTVRGDASLAEAARLMTAHRRKILPVVDDEGKLLGVLDRADLLHASRDVLDQLSAEEMVDEEE